jgi:hypothetical protein
MKITVIGFYESTGQIFMDRIDADDCCGAVAKVARNRIPFGEPENTDINIVAVLDGFPKALDDATCISSINDWPGVSDS